MFKKKVYDFDYKIYYKNGNVTTGNITCSELAPERIFLGKKMTYFGSGTCAYYNEDEICQIEIFNLSEKEE